MPRLELDSRVRRPALEKEWVIGEQKRLVNFDPYIYALYTDRLDILPEDIEKYFAECLMLSTAGLITIDPEKGFLHTSGVSYNELFRRAIVHYADNPEAVERFEAEWNGFIRAQKLVELSEEEYGVLPPFVIASPPGNVYDVGMEHTKSVTYVGLPVGHEAGKPNYKLYSVPTTELAVETHWQVVTAVADVQTSLQLLYETMDEITPNSVVAMPAILTAVDDSLTLLAQKLGFSSWDEIEQDTQASSVFEREYSRTSERRKAMIEWSVATIRQLVSDAQPKSEFEALQETLRQVFAAERGSRYTGTDYEDVAKVILEMEQLFVGNGGDPRYAKQFVEHIHQDKQQIYQGVSFVREVDLSQEEWMFTLANQARGAMLGWISGNPLAHDSYMGTGCGAAARSNLDMYGFETRTDLLANQYDVATATNPLANIYNPDTLSYSESSSTGKYKEYYDYYPDICHHCHERKPYVAHPKSEEVKCAGWCSDCET